MIRTHKPRGYAWTHASAFQQTKEFRNISYDECAAPASRLFTPNPNAALSDEERRRKRRRIERLADDFLNGQPLFISSARPCPESLKQTISWNQKSSTDPKFEFPQSTVSGKSTSLWEDVDDYDAILGKHRPGLQPSSPQVSSTHIAHTSDSVNEDLEPPDPQAIPRPARRLKSASISTGPSSDALRKAAALRARKANQVEREPPEPELASGRRLRRSDKQTLERREERLSRRESDIVSAKSDREEESLDELRLSMIETPTNPLRRTRPSDLSQPVARLAVSDPSRSGQDLESEYPSAIGTPRISETTNLLRDESHDSERPENAQATNAFIDSNSYHTAHEESDIHSNDDQEGGNVARNFDSQTRLLKNQGFEGASPTSWRAINRQPLQQNVTPMQVSADSRQSAIVIETNSTLLEPSSTLARSRRSARHSAAAQTQPAAQFRPTTRSRRQSVYKIEPAPANGSSPFKWRRKINFSSSDEIIVQPRQKQAKPPNNKNVLQSAPVTPAATVPQRSSNQPAPSAQIDAAHSSPVLTSHTPANAAGATLLPQSLPETWAGTQAMLLKAQRDLVTSPEKPEQTPAAAKEQDFVTLDDESQHQASQKSDREPLKQLSQEPMPSTQALIGDFVGFSTVKKPWRGGPRELIESPSALLRVKETGIKPTNGTSPRTSDHHDRSLQTRPSGLRFSMESGESPLQSTRLDDAPSPPSPIIRRGADWSSTDVATSSKKSGSRNAATKSCPVQQQVPAASAEGEIEEKWQSLSFSTSAALPSFQAAQAWSSLPLSQDEDSNIDRTIDELTAHLLDTTDMQGVLS